MSLGSVPRGSYLCELMSQPFAELTIFSIPENETDVRSWVKYIRQTSYIIYVLSTSCLRVLLSINSADLFSMSFKSIKKKLGCKYKHMY